MITSSIPTLTVQSSNLLADLDSSHYPAALGIIVECLPHSALSKALTASKDVPLKLLSLAFSSAKYNKAKDVVSFEVTGGKVVQLSKPIFARLLGLPSSG
ncbi:unnamed protein product [Lactuca saligna]|uniref:Uncharacterized protein n=1 Tax=Lactuca saligna TaxID=75948 RepID=A0AA36E8C4_LACSI|nr:unnamed protein product [Lactuca saligna]